MTSRCRDFTTRRSWTSEPFGARPPRPVAASVRSAGPLSCPRGGHRRRPAPSSRGGRRCATAGSITFISPRGGADPVVPPFGGRDIWQGLYEFPLLETPEAADFGALLRMPRFAELLGDAPWRLLGSMPVARHQLSHQTIACGFPPHRDPFAYACRRSAGRSDRDVGRLCRAAAYRPLPDELPEVEGVSGQE